MVKVSSLHHTVWHWFANHTISPVRHTLFTDLMAKILHGLQTRVSRWTRLIERQGLGVWLIALGVTLLLMRWNGLLLFSLLMGLGTTLLVQQVYSRPLCSWQTLVKWFTGSYTTSILAVGCGLLSLIASYITLLIWRDTNSFWLALAILLQGLGVLSVLGLCLWQLFKQDKQRLTPTQIDYWINHLTALDPLKRLIAIRQINHFVESTCLDSQRTQELREYLQLLLQQESEPTIQNAITEGLEILNP
ncbi:MAG: hypothetical protein HC851_01320 [Acaryochloris sp. RU_4_1]|nr:hypothetical protein [Acaryochloris sp. SU_5_25]NJM64389.1 hypothetical protein [Acaryochloris sp. RU_4_1]NJR53476.1 hypothetical protein [Acaryochloris sp. CRU_2_0]